MTSENLFAGDYLDRRAEARLRSDWLDEARADPDTLYLVMKGSTALVRVADAGATSVAFLTGSDERILATHDTDRLVLLGWFRERRCVLVTVDASATSGQQESFEELRPLACDLPVADAGLLAYARALVLWSADHRHCGRCGGATHAIRAGHARSCKQCGHTSFPRIDPAIIVLVHDGDRVLLGRQAAWPANRYSTIAGFVEPGESLEDAVRREVQEETGIHVSQIHYQSSQPWPFPASLMLGFAAQGVHATPVLNDAELEDARWLTRDELRAGVVLLPPPESISRRLIEHWLAAEAAAAS
jgi:NAD+ diphosphatase